MTDREAMKLALEALVDFGWHIENCPQFPTWAEPKKHPPCTCGYDTAITALRQALEQPECNPHPDAPHGFNRESSHSLGRYVCDCEGWEPERKWQGLTDEEIAEGAKQSWVDKQAFESAVWWAEEKLKEKNHG